MQIIFRDWIAIFRSLLYPINDTLATSSEKDNTVFLFRYVYGFRLKKGKLNPFAVG